jgi:putative copper resistance protein D
VGWTCFALLTVTGTYNLSVRGVRFASFTDEAWLASSHGRVILLKLLSFAVVLCVSAFHDFSIGPRATDALAKSPASEEAQRLRARASVLGRLNAVMGLVLVVLAVIIVRGVP